MPCRMSAFPVVLLFLAIIAFAFDGFGPTQHQDTHAQDNGAASTAGWENRGVERL